MTVEPASEPTPRSARFRCSFCMKSQDQVERLIAGPGVHICNACVDLCVPIMSMELPAPLTPESIMTPERMPTDQLLRTLVGYNTAFESIDTAMQEAVDILRAREVAWSAIGESLGVSRQAAWKRFG